MCDIFFYGEYTEKFKEYALSVLSGSYSVRAWDGEKFYALGEGYDLNFYFTSRLCYLNTPFPSVVILCGNFYFAKNFEVSDNVIFIADSSENTQIENVTRHKLPVITCGNSSMDTVSFSSIGDDRVTVSLNREVTALSGKNISPFELPVYYSELYGLYPVLSLFALRVLLDNYNSEMGKLF